MLLSVHNCMYRVTPRVVCWGTQQQQLTWAPATICSTRWRTMAFLRIKRSRAPASGHSTKNRRARLMLGPALTFSTMNRISVNCKHKSQTQVSHWRCSQDWLFPISSHNLTITTVSSRVHLILSSNLYRKFKTLLQDSFSWHLPTNTKHLSWKNCTGFPFQNVLSIKSLVRVSVL